MMRITISSTALVCALFFAGMTDGSGASAADDRFARANTAYEEGEYRKAVEGYRRLIADGHYSSDLFYNLGNAWVRLGRPGRALLSYERALLLDPGHAEARLNADFVRSELPEIPGRSGAMQRFFSMWSASSYAILLSVAAWVLVLVLVAGLLTRFTVFKLALGMLAALSVVFGVMGFLAVRSVEPDARSAMVVEPSVKARFAPATTSGTVCPVPEGTPVRILNSSDDWHYVELPDKRLGWIESASAEPILPAATRTE